MKSRPILVRFIPRPYRLLGGSRSLHAVVRVLVILGGRRDIRVTSQPLYNKLIDAKTGKVSAERTA